MSSDEHKPDSGQGGRQADTARGGGADTETEELRRLNEALKQRSAELERREREFRTLADNVPAMFSYLDADQCYRYVNRRYERHWGRPAAEIVGKTAAELLGPQGYALARPHIERALAGEQVTYQGAFDYADGAHTMQVSYVPDVDGRGKVHGFFTLVDDITPLTRAEHGLRERECRLRAIMDTAPDAVITIDRQGSITNFNRAAEAMFGYSAAEAVGANVRLLMPAPYCDEHDDYLARYHRTGERHVIGQRRELRGLRKNGAEFPLEVTVTEVVDFGLFVGIARDLSDRRRLEKEVARASTFEQERIGQEIHDGLGQKLTALSMMAASLKRDLARQNVPESRTLNELIEHLRQALEEARALSRGLAPVPLTEQGLAAALGRLAGDMQAATGIACHFETDPRYPVEVENRTTAMQLYRIAQEAVHNAIKHGRPRNISIRLVRSGRCAELRVSDDGSGFRADIGGGEGFGLRIMRYRAAVVGAEMSIESTPESGTLVRCKLSALDLQEEDEEEE
jgi:two-component system CheB/CheR fusion protein